MPTIFDSINTDWSKIVIPLAVFVVSIIALFWLRKMALDRLERWSKRINWSVGNSLILTLRGPLSLLCLIISVYLGLAVSSIAGNWKVLAGDILWSLFTVAITITILNVIVKILVFYGTKFNIPHRTVSIANNVIRVVILIVAVLVILDIWGVPTTAVILLIAVAAIIAVVAFRDSLPDLFASFQIAAIQEFKVGDYIKLESGEEGYITEISWNKTRLECSDGSAVLVPNNALIHHKVINYGRPLKKAKNPFRFNTRAHLIELTGLKARNLVELKNILKGASDSVIYYHTHHYLEEHQYSGP